MRKNKDLVEERLRAERPMHRAPADFAGRVMSRLCEEPVANTAAEPRRLLWPRLALAFALVAIAAVFAFEFLNPQPEPVVIVAANEVPPPAPAESVSFSLPLVTAEQVQALTVKLDQPLEKELKNVISDTRLAIQFVAANFLPEK